MPPRNLFIFFLTGFSEILVLARIRSKKVKNNFIPVCYLHFGRASNPQLNGLGKRKHPGISTCHFPGDNKKNKKTLGENLWILLGNPGHLGISLNASLKLAVVFFFFLYTS
ncbi:hypothetical protein [Thiovibrio frasassiensis]|uniref:Uncharacterized protein n=1 Tax=Thiovibrio frasassiensis TaxID=2984131 RepID=A0A9X4MHZ2_9BACT|nr:hypothetical protein [Thiovibrio frasassiensis]MDG4476688.1 hypothetical protein [Thiovibrio frasassiensis]